MACTLLVLELYFSHVLVGRLSWAKQALELQISQVPEHCSHSFDSPMLANICLCASAESVSAGKELHILDVCGTGLAFIKPELARIGCTDVWLPTFRGCMVNKMFQDGLQRMEIGESSISKIRASRPIKVLIAQTGGAPGLLVVLINIVGREHHANVYFFVKNGALATCALR